MLVHDAGSTLFTPNLLEKDDWWLGLTRVLHLYIVRCNALYLMQVVAIYRRFARKRMTPSKDCSFRLLLIWSLIFSSWAFSYCCAICLLEIHKHLLLCLRCLIRSRIAGEENLKKAKKEREITDGHVMAFQCVGQIVGEVLRPLGGERCECGPQLSDPPPLFLASRSLCLVFDRPIPPCWQVLFLHLQLSSRLTVVLDTLSTVATSWIMRTWKQAHACVLTRPHLQSCAFFRVRYNCVLISFAFQNIRYLSVPFNMFCLLFLHWLQSKIKMVVICWGHDLPFCFLPGGPFSVQHGSWGSRECQLLCCWRAIWPDQGS